MYIIYIDIGINVTHAINQKKGNMKKIVINIHEKLNLCGY